MSKTENKVSVVTPETPVMNAETKPVRVRVRMPTLDEIEAVKTGFDNLESAGNAFFTANEAVFSTVEKRKMGVVLEKIRDLKVSFVVRTSKVSIKNIDSEVVESVRGLTIDEVRELLAIKAERDAAKTVMGVE